MELSWTGGNESFPVTKGEFAIEEIEGESLVCFSATAAHHEIHGEHRVYIEDVSICLLMPLPAQDPGDKLELQFRGDACHPDWERTMWSNFYQPEHLLIVNCAIQASRTTEGYEVEIEGEIAEGVERSFDHQPRVRCTYKTALGNRIDRKRNFFLA